MILIFKNIVFILFVSCTYSYFASVKYEICKHSIIIERINVYVDRISLVCHLGSVLVLILKKLVSTHVKKRRFELPKFKEKCAIFGIY